MKIMLLNLWAWVLAHPEQVVGALLSLLVMLATVANTRAKGRPVGWFAKFVDRLAIRTRANAANAGWSWPIVGRSIFEAAVDASAPPSEPGFTEAALMRWIAGVASLALCVYALTACRMPEPDGCSPGSRRCHQDTPQVCSPGQRWTPADVTCSSVRATCVVQDGVPACVRGEQ